MKILIILLCLMFNSAHSYEYLNGMLLNDLTSGDKFRIGYASGFIGGIASDYKAICIPADTTESIFEIAVDYIEKDVDHKDYPAKLAVKMALIDKWECSSNPL